MLVSNKERLSLFLEGLVLQKQGVIGPASHRVGCCFAAADKKGATVYTLSRPRKLAETLVFT